MPRLLAKLPESGVGATAGRRGAVSRAGTIASVVAHATLITLAVVATGMTHGGPPRPPKPVDEGTIFVTHEPPKQTGPSHAGQRRPTDDGVRRVATTNDPPLPPMPEFHPDVDGGPVVPPIVGVGDEFGRGDDTAGGGSLAGGAADGAGSGGSGTDGRPFDARTVEVPASLRPGSPVPRYPEMLRAARATGRVVVRFVVDTAGRIEPASVRVVSSTDPLFTSAVRVTLPALRFTPARAHGGRVRQLVELPFEFAVE